MQGQESCLVVSEEDVVTSSCFGVDFQCCQCCGAGFFFRKTFGAEVCPDHVDAFASCEGVFDQCCSGKGCMFQVLDSTK